MLRARHFSWLLVLFCIALAACKAQPKPDGTLRVVSWNLEWFPGHTPDASPEKAAEHMAAAKKIVSELKPDILLLQEVRDWAAAEELASAVPGLKVHVTSAFAGRPQNQVIASNLTADSGWAAEWKHTPGGPPRGYSFAALNLPDGRFLLTYSLHLKSNLGQLPENIAMRHESARQILAHVQEMRAIYGKRGPAAVLIAGDMNTSLDDPKFAADGSLRALRSAGFHWTHEGVPFAQRTTIPADEKFPDNCFDHIFTLGLGKQTASTHAAPKVSDHYPVILDLNVETIDANALLDLAAAEKELVSPSSGPAAAPSANPVAAPAGTINANDDAAIRAAVGKAVAIRGRIARVGATSNGSITFINFTGNDRGKFVAIVRRDHLAAIKTAVGADLESLPGKAIEVRGNVELFKDAPQIVLTAGEQIQVLPE